MNISVATMPEFDVIQRASSKPDLSCREKALSGESGFGSLLNNEASAVNKSSSSPEAQSKIHPRENKSNGAGKRTEQTSNDTEPDTQVNDKSDAVSKTANERGNNKEAGTQDDNARIGLTKADQVDSDNHPVKTGPQNEIRTDALLFNLFEAVVTANADIVNANAVLSTIVSDNTLTDNGAADGETGQSEDQPAAEGGAENGLKIGALLFDLINGADKVNADNPGRELTGLRIGQVINDIKSAAEQSEGNAGEPVAGNGLKTGDLLSNSLSGAVTKTENGLKAGDVLSDLIKRPVLRADGSSEINGVVNSENTSDNITELSPVEVNTDVELNTGNQMHAKSDIVDETLVNGGGSKERSTEGGSGENNSSSGDTAHTDLLKLKEIVEGDKKTDVKSNHFNMTQSREDALNLNPPGKDGVRESQIQGMGQVAAAHVNAEPSSKDASIDTAKQVNIDSDVDNAHLINSSNITREGGKTGETVFSVSTARTAGLHELVDKIVYVVKGNSKLGVAVEHENLGKLNINLSMEKGVVNVHIDTSDKVTREYLENNIQQIIDSLSKNGVSVGGFSVALKEHGNNPGKTFAVDKGHERKVSTEPVSARSHRGLVNIFA